MNNERNGLSRRALLRQLAYTSLCLNLSISAQAKTSVSPAISNTFDGLIEVLSPLQIDKLSSKLYQHLLTLAEHDLVIEKSLGKLSRYLDGLAHSLFEKEFSQLKEAQKLKIVSELNLSKDYGIRYLFGALRKTLMQEVYSDPSIYMHIPNYHPPQPHGYPDHHEHPK